LKYEADLTFILSWGRFDLGPIWLEIFRTIGLLGLRTIGLYCHGTVDIETILNTNQRSGVCTTILFFWVPNDYIQWIPPACIYWSHSTGACYDFFFFYFSLYSKKKNRNKPLWSQNRGVNNITIHILTTSTIVSLLFLSDQLVAIFCMTSKYNPWRAPGFTSGFFGEVRVVHLFSFLCCAIMCLWVPCCYVLCNFRIKTIFGSSLPQALVARGLGVVIPCHERLWSLPPVVCGRAHVLFTLFVLVCVWWCSTRVVLCFSSYCVPGVASLSALFIFDPPFGIL
jgi:hypothetical protein